MCLHCRAEARAQARQRHVRLLARFSLLTIGAAGVIALVVGGLMSVAPGGGATFDSVTTVAVADGEPDAPAAAPATPEPRALQPTITEGRRDLIDSIYAVREGTDVTVHFDTETLRTRFDWKFEGVVRATLPLIYGQDVRVALDSIPTGTFVRGGGLLTDLPERGIPLAVGDHRIRVWPITRPGRDGPIVVGYRASSG